MSVETPDYTTEPMPWDEPADESGKVRISAYMHVTDKTDYTYNIVGDAWPYGMDIGGYLDSLLVWFESPAAVDRMIAALHDLKTQVAIKEASEAGKTREVPE